MSAKAVVTANEAVRGGKTIPLRKTVADALQGDRCPSGDSNLTPDTLIPKINCVNFSKLLSFQLKMSLSCLERATTLTLTPTTSCYPMPSPDCHRIVIQNPWNQKITSSFSTLQVGKAHQIEGHHKISLFNLQGSTGTPKGVAHSTAGYLLYAGFTHRHVFSYYNNNDIFGCMADIGWITGMPCSPGSRHCRSRINGFKTRFL